VDLKMHFERDETSVEKIRFQRRISTEKPDIVNWKWSYLQKKLKKHTEEGRDFF
jgi:hypothetical protein